MGDHLMGEHPGGAGRQTAVPDPDLACLNLTGQELMDPERVELARADPAPEEQWPVAQVEAQVPGEAAQQPPLER